MIYSWKLCNSSRISGYMYITSSKPQLVSISINQSKTGNSWVNVEQTKRAQEPITLPNRTSKDNPFLSTTHICSLEHNPKLNRKGVPQRALEQLMNVIQSGVCNCSETDTDTQYNVHQTKQNYKQPHHTLAIPPPPGASPLCSLICSSVCLAF